MAISKTQVARKILSGAPRTMPAEDLRRTAAVGAASAIIDVRSPEAYAAGHIPGSINIPETKITALIHALTNHPGAVMVCSDGRLSSNVARAIGFTGIQGVFYLEGGLAAWDKAGGTLVETTERGTERRVGRVENESKLAGIARLMTLRLLFVGLAASAAMVAGAMRFLA